MDVLYPRCAGLDVHKDSVVASVRLAGDGPARTEARTFDTTTPGLLALSAWLAEQGCTHVAMEATGVYWKPVWHVLSDGEVKLILANAAHVRNVPGRKTDVADAIWLADLLAHGLIRPSFVPEAPTQELRALLRTRKQLVREQASHVQRLQKTLEDANLKLGSVLTQIMGVSGRAILQALIDGEHDPDKLLTLVQRGVKAPPEKLRAALQGRITQRHRFLLRLHLRQVDALDAAIAEIDTEVGRDLAPFRQAVRLLRTIPGVSDLTAQVIVSEIGTDMARFPPAGEHRRGANQMRQQPNIGEHFRRGNADSHPDCRAARRQATLHPPAQGRALAEDHTGPMRLGGRPQEGQLLAGPVQTPASSPWTQEGHLRRCRIDPDRRLPHAPRRHPLPGSRRRPLPPRIT
jgi:transposase